MIKHFHIGRVILYIMGVCPAISLHAAEKDERKAWFVQSYIPTDIKNPVQVLVDGDIQMVTLSNRLASSAVPIPSDGILRVVKEVPDPQGVKEAAYISLAEAKIPDQVMHALVIMTPIPNRQPDGLVFNTSVLSLNRFKGGDYMYINLSRSKIGIEIADEKMTLDSGEVEIKSIAEGNNPVSVPYRYSYFHAKREKWMQLNASMAITTLRSREILVFSENEVTGRIHCKSITFPVENAN